MLSAVIMLCAGLVTAGIVSAGCFFWLVYRRPSREEHAEMDSFGRPRQTQDRWPPLSRGTAARCGEREAARPRRRDTLAPGRNTTLIVIDDGKGPARRC